MVPLAFGGAPPNGPGPWSRRGPPDDAVAAPLTDRAALVRVETVTDEAGVVVLMPPPDLGAAVARSRDKMASGTCASRRRDTARLSAGAAGE